MSEDNELFKKLVEEGRTIKMSKEETSIVDGTHTLIDGEFVDEVPSPIKGGASSGKRKATMKMNIARLIDAFIKEQKKGVLILEKPKEEIKNQSIMTGHRDVLCTLGVNDKFVINERTLGDQFKAYLAFRIKPELVISSLENKES